MGGIVLKRRIISIGLFVIFMFNSLIAYGDLNISSKSALLMDYSTGKIIYAENEHEKLAPASLTKIMTLLIAMESLDKDRIKLDDKVYISNHAASIKGSTAFLDEGESQTVENLIKAVAIRSANDASVALAEHILGSEESFVKHMNERAGQLGMNNTNFTNASGWPDTNLYSTAYDVALMSRELIKHENIRKYLTIYMEDLAVGKSKSSIQNMVNTNRLIKDYQGAIGIKTGSTNEAGHCVSGAAIRDNLHLIAVIMGAKTSKIRFDEAKSLLDYGFANFESLEIGRSGDIIATIGVEKGSADFLDIKLERDSLVLLAKGKKGNLDKEFNYPESIKAPIKSGQVIGEMIVTIDGTEVDRVNLVSSIEVKSGSYLRILKKTISNYITGK